MAGGALNVGFKLPNIGGLMCPPEWANVATVMSLAETAAGLGFDSVWLQDHVITPQEMEDHTDPPFLEPFTVSMRLAALVPSVRIGVATYVLPLREPLTFTKQLVTAAAFYPGRLIAGLGSGRYRSEFERYGSDLFDQRDKILTEYVDLMRELFTQDRVTYQGRFRGVDDAEMYPKPLPGSLALWLHGTGPMGVRRAARIADGLIAGSSVLERFAEIADWFRTEREATGRGPAPIAVSLRVDQGAPGEPEQMDHGILLRGTAEVVARVLSRYAALGLTDVLLTFPAETIEELVGKMTWFAQEVRPMIAAEQVATGAR
jgi:alkanesulfonate monooxygenase SsuD/methylene tetrahydromethanopterin reductase-like flavin-dependent oxidoreductase (luciferase family)